jgi:hypothetical protein
MCHRYAAFIFQPYATVCSDVIGLVGAKFEFNQSNEILT